MDTQETETFPPSDFEDLDRADHPRDGGGSESRGANRKPGSQGKLYMENQASLAGWSGQRERAHGGSLSSRSRAARESAHMSVGESAGESAPFPRASDASVTSSSTSTSSTMQQNRNLKEKRKKEGKKSRRVEGMESARQTSSAQAEEEVEKDEESEKSQKWREREERRKKKARARREKEHEDEVASLPTVANSTMADWPSSLPATQEEEFALADGTSTSPSDALEAPEINLHRQGREHEACHPLAYEPDQAADELAKNGWVCVRFSWMTPPRLDQLRESLLEDVRNFPEFKPNADSHVLGGFSALGNPASFHNSSVRELRMYAMAELVPLFSSYARKHLTGNPGQQWKLEQLVDRMMLRPKGATPSAEAWHRDEAPDARDDDCIFGGWWNFNNESQFFSCVPGSHSGVRGHSGFGTVQDKEEKKIYAAKKHQVDVRAGHMLIFHEHILHEIVARKSKVDLLRLFIGWRLTQATTPLTPNLRELLENQAVIPLKSKQVPPMYAKLHWTNWRDKIVNFTQRNIVDACTCERTVGSGSAKGTVLRIVDQHMKSLREYNLPRYSSYNPNEISILFPDSNWTTNCGCGKSGVFKRL